MKTKEEIEKLANKEYPVKRGGPMWMQNTDDNKRYYKQEGYIKGYTQCQLDMAKEVEQVDIICPKCKGINQYFIEKNGDYKCAYTDCEHTFNKTRLI